MLFVLMMAAKMQSVSISVCGQIHWRRVKELAGRQDQPVLVVCRAACQAGLPQRFHQDILMPLG